MCYLNARFTASCCPLARVVATQPCYIHTPRYSDSDHGYLWKRHTEHAHAAGYRSRLFEPTADLGRFMGWSGEQTV